MSIIIFQTNCFYNWATLSAADADRHRLCHRSVAAKVTCSWQLSYDEGLQLQLQSPEPRAHTPAPISGYLNPNLGLCATLQPAAMFGSRSAYKFAAKLSPAQRDHQQGQVLYQREAKKKKCKLPFGSESAKSSVLNASLGSQRIASQLFEGDHIRPKWGIITTFKKMMVVFRGLWSLPRPRQVREPISREVAHRPRPEETTVTTTSVWPVVASAQSIYRFLTRAWR